MDSGVVLTMLDVLNRIQETEYVRCPTTLFLKKVSLKNTVSMRERRRVDKFGLSSSVSVRRF